MTSWLICYRCGKYFKLPAYWDYIGSGSAITQLTFCSFICREKWRWKEKEIKQKEEGYNI